MSLGKAEVYPRGAKMEGKSEHKMVRRRDKSVGTTLKRAFITMLLAALSHAAVAATDDKVVRFSTDGYDYYADGTTVVDGECYALVWSPKGAAFAGFNADGTTVSPSDRLVLAAPLAQGGRCRDTLFQISADEYAELEGGEWAVCLVDTRNANGAPAGVNNNAPLRVNRWGVVKAGVKIEPKGASGMSPDASAANATRGLLSASASDGACAGVLSSVPDSVKPPKITGLDVLDSGEVWLEVADTVPFLSYTIISGSEPGNLQEDGCAEVVDGKNGGKISIGTAQSSVSRFFRVIRAE